MIEEGNAELAMMKMINKLERQARQASSRQGQSNLTPLQHRTIRELKADHNFIVVQTDKNCGPAIIERRKYTSDVYVHHLSDTATYQRLTPTEAREIQANTKQDIKHLVECEHYSNLTTAERTFFDRSFKNSHRMPQLYLLYKIHKTPIATRPVVSCVGSFPEIASRWLDVKMGELLPMSRTYLRDSNHLQEELAALGVLPPNTKLFTFDAVSMYTNISISDGLTAFKALLIEYAHEVPKNFPTELFLKVLKIVVTKRVSI